MTTAELAAFLEAIERRIYRIEANLLLAGNLPPRVVAGMDYDRRLCSEAILSLEAAAAGSEAAGGPLVPDWDAADQENWTP